MKRALFGTFCLGALALIGVHFVSCVHVGTTSTGVGTAVQVAAAPADPLPSWNDGPARKSVIAFVETTTKDGSPDFVPLAERIAAFDNDGTLWSEQPMYFQILFAFDRVKALAPEHPEWKEKEPFASLLSE